MYSLLNKIKKSNLLFLLTFSKKLIFFCIEFLWYSLLLFLNRISDLKFNVFNSLFFYNILVSNRKLSTAHWNSSNVIITDGGEKINLLFNFDFSGCVLYNFLSTNESLISGLFVNKVEFKQYEKWSIALYKFNRIYFRQIQTRLGFYNNTSNLVNLLFSMEVVWIHFCAGLKSLIKNIRFWLFPICVSLLIVYSSVLLKVFSFNKLIFAWLMFIMIIYWLVSGFVFFFKKYQYGKYTSAIQRFWRRSYILFWLLESSLLLVFVLLTFIASQESFYMFDQIQIYKTHLFSWRIFFLKVFPLVLLIILTHFFLLTLKWNVFSKHSVWLLFFTVILTYIVWLEFYQFFHITNFYGNLVWNYDIDDKLWSLELETRRTRIVNHYIMWLLILKFWHLLFVYVFWIFFVLRNIEKKQVKYTMFSANQQNLIILLIMSWLFMFPWIKIYLRKFLDVPYIWFYVNNRNLFFRVFFNDLKIYWYGLTEKKIIFVCVDADFFKKISFFYWIENNKNLLINLSRKHSIRNQIFSTFFINS